VRSQLARQAVERRFVELAFATSDRLSIVPLMRPIARRPASDRDRLLPAAYSRPHRSERRCASRRGGGGPRPRRTRGAIACDQGGCRKPLWRGRPVGRGSRRAPLGHAALYPQTLRNGGRNFLGICAHVPSGIRPSPIDRPSPCRASHHFDRVRRRLLGPIPLQPHVPPSI